jgi:putative aldouronate transport system permease protein
MYFAAYQRAAELDCWRSLRVKLPRKKVNSVVAGHDLRSQITLQMMVLPAAILVILFSYLPMYGVTIAFKNYNIFKGIADSPWAKNSGFEHFIDFFSSESSVRVLFNTVYIAGLKLLFLTWPPVLLATLLNELRSSKLMKLSQTLSYLPHFIGWSVAYGIFYSLLNPSSGAVNLLLKQMGLISSNINFLAETKYYRPLIILSGLWKSIGWSSIIYLGVICGIDHGLYEALAIDGGNRWHKFRYITWPHLKPTFAILFILECGKIMSGGDGFDQAYAFGNALNRQVADILDTYIMRTGFENGRYSYATAVGLFKSVVNLLLLLGANKMSKMMTEESLF